MRVRQNFFAIALLAFLLTASSAHAEAADLTPAGPGRFALGGELGYFSQDRGQDALHVFAPRLAAHYAVDARWSIAFDFGVVMLAQSVETGTGDDFAFGLGNPTGLLLYRGELGALRYRVGLGGAAPVARIDRDGSGRLRRTAYNGAQALSGLWDVWLFAPARGAVLGFGKLEGDLHPEAQFELEVAPALMIPAYEAFGSDSLETFLPAALTLSTAKGPVRFGLRFQAVLMPASEPDALQLALEPQLKVDLGSAFVEARYTANLDEPLGGERGPRIWGLHLAAGGAL